MIKETLSDDKKRVSSGRIMSFIALFAAVGISFTSLAMGTPIDSETVMWFLTGAFAGKVGSKFAERK